MVRSRAILRAGGDLPVPFDSACSARRYRVAHSPTTRRLPRKPAARRRRQSSAPFRHPNGHQRRSSPGLGPCPSQPRGMGHPRPDRALLPSDAASERHPPRAVSRGLRSSRRQRDGAWHRACHAGRNAGDRSLRSIAVSGLDADLSRNDRKIWSRKQDEMIGARAPSVAGRSCLVASHQFDGNLGDQGGVNVPSMEGSYASTISNRTTASYRAESGRSLHCVRMIACGTERPDRLHCAQTIFHPRVRFRCPRDRQQATAEKTR